MKFHYLDKVKIKRGFFKECEGIVIYYDKINNRYLIEGDKSINNYIRTFNTEEYEEDLEVLK